MQFLQRKILFFQTNSLVPGTEEQPVKEMITSDTTYYSRNPPIWINWEGGPSGMQKFWII
jgi:hypothetical protein